MRRIIEIALTIQRLYRNHWLGLWAVKLLFALAVTLPILILIQSRLDHSAFAQILLGEWPADVIVELIFTGENIFSASLLFMLTIVALGFLFKQFLNGGIFDCLVNRAAPTRQRFFAQSSVMFLQHLTISAWMLLIYFLLFLTAMFIGEMVTSAARRLIPELDLTRFVLRVGVTYLVIIVGVVYSDLVRIHRTRVLQAKALSGGEERFGLAGMGDSFKAAYTILVRRGLKIFGMYLAFYLPFILCWLAVEGLALIVTGGLSNMLGSIIEFALFQACALVRVWQSLACTLAMTDFVVPQPEPKLEEASDRATVLP